MGLRIISAIKNVARKIRRPILIKLLRGFNFDKSRVKVKTDEGFQ